MERNCRFEGSTIVLFEDKRFDLHNDYDLASLGSDLAGTEVTLRFVKNSYAFPGAPDRVRMTCRGNGRCAFNNLLSGDEDTGFELAWFRDDCPWGHFVSEEQFGDHGVDGLHIEVGTGLIVRITCDAVEFAVEGIRSLP